MCANVSIEVKEMPLETFLLPGPPSPTWPPSSLLLSHECLSSSSECQELFQQGRAQQEQNRQVFSPLGLTGVAVVVMVGEGRADMNK